MPDVDARNRHPAFSFVKLRRLIGANASCVVWGTASLSLNFSSCFCSLTVSLHQSFIYEVTVLRSLARHSLLFRASRPPGGIPSDEIEIRCLGIGSGRNGYGNETGRRFLPLRQRNLARQNANSFRQTSVLTPARND